MLKGCIGLVPAHERPQRHPVVQLSFDEGATAKVEEHGFSSEENSGEAQDPAPATHEWPGAKGRAQSSNDGGLFHWHVLT